MSLQFLQTGDLLHLTFYGYDLKVIEVNKVSKLSLHFQLLCCGTQQRYPRRTLTVSVTLHALRCDMMFVSSALFPIQDAIGMFHYVQ